MSYLNELRCNQTLTEAAGVLRLVARENGRPATAMHLSLMKKSIPAGLPDLLLWVIWFFISLGHYSVFNSLQ